MVADLRAKQAAAAESLGGAVDSKVDQLKADVDNYAQQNIDNLDQWINDTYG